MRFAPDGFFSYATLFSVAAADATALAVGGLPGQTLAAAVSMAIGAAIGLGGDVLSGSLAAETGRSARSGHND